MQSLLENDVLSCRFKCDVDKPSTMYSLANKQSIIQALSTHFILFTRKAEIDRLGQGLDHVGLLSLLKQYPGVGLNIFLPDETILTASYMIDLLDVNYSPLGSNNRAKEEEVMIMFYNYLQVVEGRR